MSPRPRTLFIGIAILAGFASLTLSACGSSDDTAGTTTVADSATTTSPGDGGSVADDSSTNDASGSGEIVDVCSELTVDEVGALVGGTVTVEEDPGGGCTFDQEDLRAPTIAFASSDVGSDDTDGTFNEARIGAFSVLTDPVRTEPGIGEYSTVATGTIAGGESQQGAGLAQEGSTLVQVTVLQSNGLDAAAVQSLVTQALTLAVSTL